MGSNDLQHSALDALLNSDFKDEQQLLPRRQLLDNLSFMLGGILEGVMWEDNIVAMAAIAAATVDAATATIEN